MTETTAPAPSRARRAAENCLKCFRTWTGRLPVQVTVRYGSTMTRKLAAGVVNELNGLTGLALILGVMKLVSLFMQPGAAAGYAEAGAAIVTYVVIRRLTVVRAVPAAPENQA